MTRDTLRAAMLDGIDRALWHTLIVSGAERRILQAVRVVAVQDDAFVDRVNAIMGPQRSPEEGVLEMSKVQSIDWADLLTKIKSAVSNPALVAFFELLVSTLAGKKAAGPVVCDPGCDCAAAIDCAICASVHTTVALLAAKERCQQSDPSAA